MLYSSDGLCPRFYGLPKIHKPGIPLRPIVSFVNSPTYAISGYLARILSPVVGNTDYTIGGPSSRLEKKPTRNSWTRHALCDSVLSYGRNRWKFEHVIRNSMGNEIWSIYNDKYFIDFTCKIFIFRNFFSLSKIPANLQISQEIKLLTLVKN